MWKHFGILLFGLVAISNAATLELQSDFWLTGDSRDKISQLIALALVDQVGLNANSRVASGVSTSASKDPASIDDVYITLPDDKGTITFCHSTVSGASQISTDFNFDFGFPSEVKLNIKIPLLRIAGKHEALIKLNRILKITSSDDYSVELTGGFIDAKLKAEISFDGYIDVKSADTQIGFTSLIVRTSGTYLNRDPINLEELSARLPALWGKIWPDFKPQVDTKLRDFANNLLEHCNGFTLIDGDYSCIVMGRKSMQNQLADESSKIFNVAESICPAPPAPGVPSPPGPPVDEPYLIYSETITNYGPWAKDPEMCEPGTFVTGFQLKVETYQTIFADDTSVNGIRLFCGSWETPIKSNDGQWGDWGKKFGCAHGGYMNGFQLRSEDDDQLDNTATNNIRMFCSAESGYIEGDGLKFGDWRSVIMCKEGYAVCGLKTQIHPDQSGINDDTSLNNIALVCCPKKD